MYSGRDEGTDAHEWAANVLEGRATLDHVPDDCREGVTTYVEHVKSNRASHMVLETSWDSLTIPEFGGTIDCLLLDGKRAAIYDYKNGKNDVKAEGNTQLLCYAAIIGEHYAIDEFWGVIVQPNSKIIKGRKPKVTQFAKYEVDTHRERVAAAAVSDEKNVGQQCAFCPILQAGLCEEGKEYGKTQWWSKLKHLQPIYAQ